MDGEEEDGARLLRESRDDLRADRLIVKAYGETIPDVWTGVQFDGPMLVLLLTDPATYRDDLMRLVVHPERVEVREAQFSRRTLDAVHEEVTSVIGHDSDRWTSHGQGLEQVHITLRSNEAVLAQELQARFGDALAIRLGRHGFPLSTTRIDPPPAPGSTLDLPGLLLAAELECEVWRPGETIRGILRLTNTDASGTIRFRTGSPARGVLLDPTGVPVAGYSGAVRGVGREVDLAPGDEATVRFVSGSDTFDPTLGAALPPGEYLLLTSLRISTDHGRELLVAPTVHVRLE